MALTKAKVTVLPSASSDVDTIVTAFEQLGVSFAPIDIDLTKIKDVSYKKHIQFCDFISRNVIYTNAKKLPTMFPVLQDLSKYTVREIMNKRMLDTNLDIKLDPFLRQDFYDLDIYTALEEVVENAQCPQHMQRTLDVLINALLHLDALRKLRADWEKWHTGAFVNLNTRVIDQRDNSARFLRALKKILPLIKAKLYIFQIKTIIF